MNLTGQWEGSYSQQEGTIEPARLLYEIFELTIKDTDGEITGEGIETSLDNEPFSIHGFHEEGMISFIKKYTRDIYHDEVGNVYSDDDYESHEINHYGRYNEEEEVFQGMWEIEFNEEQESLQEDYTSDITYGQWFLRKKDQ